MLDGIIIGCISFALIGLFHPIVILSWTKYIREKDLAQKRRAWIFTDTLIFFHIGVLFGYYAVKFLSEKGIWLTFLPIMTALILVSPVFEYHTITVESKSSSLPSRNTVK